MLAFLVLIDVLTDKESAEIKKKNNALLHRKS